MRPVTALIAATALVIGLGAGSVSYQLATAAGPPAGPEVVPAATTRTPAPAPARVRPGTRFRWAPCVAPAVLRDHTCVTEVVRTVVVPAPAAPVVAAPAPAPVPAAPAAPPAPAVGTDHPDATAPPGDDGPGDEADDGEDHGEDHEQEPEGD